MVHSELILRGLRIHLKLRQPSEVLQWVESLPAEVRAEVSADWLSAVSRLSAADPWYCGFLFVLNESGTAAGSGAFKGPPDASGTVELAYGTDESQQGQGLATEAVGLLVQFCREQQGICRVIAHTLPENTASIRVLQKNQFCCCGLRQHPEDGEVLLWERLL